MDYNLHIDGPVDRADERSQLTDDHAGCQFCWSGTAWSDRELDPSGWQRQQLFFLRQSGSLFSKLPQALPSPDRTTLEADAASFAPRNPADEEMARLWCDMLDLTKVGVRDNFFDLGGNSLLAVRLIGRINQRLGTKLGVSTIFRVPTIEGMSALVKQSLQAEKESPQVISLQNGHNGLPLYFIGAGPVEHRIARLIGEDRTIFAIDVPIPAEWHRATKTLDRAALPTFEQLGALYGDVLRSHAGSSPCVVAGYSFGGKVAFEAARVVQRANDNVALSF